MAANTRHPQHSSQAMAYPHPSTYLNMASTSMASPLGAGRVGLMPGGPGSGHGGDVMITVPPGVVGVNDVNHDIARMSEEGVQETVRYDN